MKRKSILVLVAIITAINAFSQVTDGIYVYGQKCSYDNGVCFRVNPSNADEAIIVDPADQIIFEIMTVYDKGLIIPNSVSLDGRTLKCTAIDIEMLRSKQTPKVFISSSVRTILNNAFLNCRIDELTIDEGVVVFGDNVFCLVKGIDEISLPNSLFSMGKNVFRGAALKQINFGKGLYQMGENCFADNDALTEVTLPRELYYMGKGCFDNCTNLKKVALPEWIIEYDNCFNNCTAIEEIEFLGKDVPYIYQSFRDVDKEKVKVIVPKGKAQEYASLLTEEGFVNIVERESSANPTLGVEDTVSRSIDKIYSIDGHVITSGENIRPNQLYILQSGDGKATKHIAR